MAGKREPEERRTLSREACIVLGAVLVLAGIFLVFQNTRVYAAWHVWHIGSFGLPTGVVVLPLLAGIGMWVYRPRWLAAKIVVAAGLLFLLVTIFLSVQLRFVSTGLFNYILMFGALAAGLALLLRGWFAGRGKE